MKYDHQGPVPHLFLAYGEGGREKGSSFFLYVFIIILVDRHHHPHHHYHFHVRLHRPAHVGYRYLLYVIFGIVNFIIIIPFPLDFIDLLMLVIVIFFIVIFVIVIFGIIIPFLLDFIGLLVRFSWLPAGSERNQQQVTTWCLQVCTFDDNYKITTVILLINCMFDDNIFIMMMTMKIIVMIY